MPLVASTLSFECDETSRDSMSVVGSTSNPIIYQANVTNIRAGLFDGEPSSATFVTDISNITAVRLIVRKNHPQGTILIDKTGTRDNTTTYVTWANGTKQHFLFALSDVETNQAVPSDGTLDIYAVIEVTTASGPVVVGHFNGSIDFDGITGVDNPVLPGTGAQHSNYVWAGPTTGSPALPTFRALVPADIPGGGGGGSGSVTSVAFSAPNIFTVTGSPITASGTINLALATQSANTILSGPSSGSAATPTFRNLVAGDIPSLSSVYQPLDSDLTAIAALTTDSFGRTLLTKTDAGSIRTYIGAGTSSFSGLFTGLTFTGSNLTSIATRNFSDLQFSSSAGKVNYLSGLLSLVGSDGNSQITANLANGNNTDNVLAFYGTNGQTTSFQVNGRGALTLGDDDQVSGFYGLTISSPSFTASRTLSWPDETGTISVNRFNVKTYVAKGDGVTDDTAAIQAAINACAAAGGGTVYFPKGVYIIAGALQDTSGANSQLTLPSVSAPGGEQYTVRFLGETPPSQIPWYLGGGHTPSTGVVIKSTLSSGNGALLGGYGPVGSNHNFTNITVVVENLNFRMAANPTNSCLNFFYVNSAVLRKVVVDAGNWIGSTISQPTTASSYGIKMPQNNNGGNNYLDQIQVIGFYTNILNGEHVIGGQVELYSANVAMENAFAYHTSQYARLLYANCVRGLKWTGIHFIDVHKLDVEHTDLAVWYATTYDIDDGNNYGHGQVNYHIVQANTGVTNILLRNGANSLRCNTLAQQSINLVTTSSAYYPGISIVPTAPGAAVIDFTKVHDPTSVDYGGDAVFYSDGSYLVFNSKTGANPLYLNFDNNNASATVNMFAGNFVVSQAGTLTAGTVPLARIGSLGTGVAASLATANNSSGGYSPIDGTATLTNKSISLGSNTITGTTTQFNTALSGDDFAFVGAANTFTAAQINSTSGAASTPAMKYSGVPFAGTGTTSFPLVYINDANATASTTLNTSGTSFGINAHTGVGNFIDLLLDGTSKGKWDVNGDITARDISVGSGRFFKPRSDALIFSSGSGILDLSVTDIDIISGTSPSNSHPRISRDAVNGITLKSAAGTATWNDASTANSGTVANRYLFGIAVPTLTSTGTSVTNTVASTFYIGGAPIASTNTTITTPYAFFVAADVSKFGGPLIMKGYTVATLPSTAATGKVQGSRAFVTDALAPTFLATAVGGGAIVTPVFYDGTNWVAE